MNSCHCLMAVHRVPREVGHTPLLTAVVPGSKKKKLYEISIIIHKIEICVFF